MTFVKLNTDISTYPLILENMHVLLTHFFFAIIFQLLFSEILISQHKLSGIRQFILEMSVDSDELRISRHLELTPFVNHKLFVGQKKKQSAVSPISVRF